LLQNILVCHERTRIINIDRSILLIVYLFRRQKIKKIEKID